MLSDRPANLSYCVCTSLFTPRFFYKLCIIYIGAQRLLNFYQLNFFFHYYNFVIMICRYYYYISLPYLVFSTRTSFIETKLWLAFWWSELKVERIYLLYVFKIHSNHVNQKWLLLRRIDELLYNLSHNVLYASWWCRLLQLKLTYLLTFTGNDIVTYTLIQYIQIYRKYIDVTKLNLSLYISTKRYSWKTESIDIRSYVLKLSRNEGTIVEPPTILVNQLRSIYFYTSLKITWKKNIKENPP